MPNLLLQATDFIQVLFVHAFCNVLLFHYSQYGYRVYNDCIHETLFNSQPFPGHYCQADQYTYINNYVHSKLCNGPERPALHYRIIPGYDSIRILPSCNLRAWLHTTKNTRKPDLIISVRDANISQTQPHLQSVRRRRRYGYAMASAEVNWSFGTFINDITSHQIK